MNYSCLKIKYNYQQDGTTVRTGQDYTIYRTGQNERKENSTTI